MKLVNVLICIVLLGIDIWTTAEQCGEMCDKHVNDVMKITKNQENDFTISPYM